jgi:AraC family transcriptional regulator
MKLPEIKQIPEIKTVCMSTRTSLINNNTKRLWSLFMPRMQEINNKKDDHFIAVYLYPEAMGMNDFTLQTIYKTPAAVPVTNFPEILPQHMEAFIIPEGLYAVFEHKGTVSDFNKTTDYVYNKWLPESNYSLCKRPHFEILGNRYLGPNNPGSIEDVYIPITREGQ